MNDGKVWSVCRVFLPTSTHDVVPAGHKRTHLAPTLCVGGGATEKKERALWDQRGILHVFLSEQLRPAFKGSFI